MITATTLIVEVADQSITVILRQPMTLYEVWKHFSFPGRSHPVCTLLPKRVIRVIF